MKWMGMAAAAALMCVAGQAAAAELVTNGGFENGVRTDTQNGASNMRAPVSWDVNAAFDADQDFNEVVGGATHSGDHALQFGDYDVNPIVQLSQTFADVAGAAYQLSFWFLASRGGDPDALLNASINGDSVFSSGDTVNSYTQAIVSFTGTGRDTLAFAANTNPGEWYLDDVSVTGPAATSAAPEPATWALMALGVGVAGVGLRRRGRLALRTA